MMEANALPEATPILNVVGEKVALGPIRRDLLPLYTRWMNDFEVLRTLSGNVRPMTAEAEMSWYDQASKSESTINFTIYERATSRPIGNTSLMDVNHAHRTATFGILIGEKDCWGKGYGTETTRLMLDYAFTILGLHNVMLTVDSYNERGIRAYTRAGFKVIGRRREAHRLGGRPFDVILMDCLASELESSLLHKLLPGD
jgi:RimJ/RimL family protein N-acetyltransferase